MEVFVLKKDLSNLRRIAKQVSKLLSKDKVGVIPTETLYGIAANPFSEEAVKKVFKVKKRDYSKPIILLVSTIEQLELLVKEIPPVAKPLIEHFWPGPLTIVFPAKPEVPKLVTGGTGTVAIRMSSSPIVRKVINFFNAPITGTSANISGESPLTSPKEVKRVLKNVDFLIDAGELKKTKPSTVVSVVTGKLELIRPGEVDITEIIKVYSSSSSSPSSLSSISK